MTAEKLFRKKIPIDEQTDFMPLVIHQTENTGGSRMGVQIMLHLLRRTEAQTGGPDLFGENLGLEGLFSRHDQEIEVRLLPVGQEQVFADAAAEQSLHQFTVLNGVGVLVIDTVILHGKGIQKIIAALLTGGAGLLRSPGKKRFDNRHKKTNSFFDCSFKQSASRIVTQLSQKGNHRP